MTRPDIALEDIDRIARAAAQNSRSAEARQLKDMLEGPVKLQRNLVNEIRSVLGEDYNADLATETLLALRDLADPRRLAYAVWPRMLEHAEGQHGPLNNGSLRSHKAQPPNPESGTPDALAASDRRQTKSKIPRFIRPNAAFPDLDTVLAVHAGPAMIRESLQRHHATEDALVDALDSIVAARDTAEGTPRWQALMQAREWAGEVGRQMEAAVLASITDKQQIALERAQAAKDAGLDQKAWCLANGVTYEAQSKMCKRIQRQVQEIESYWLGTMRSS